MILLFIFAGCTGWLQPLGLVFNLVFKRLLKQLAGMWLASEMQEQLATTRDPTNVKLNIKLSYLKPHFCAWNAEALRQMATKRSLMLRGWDESGMGRALLLAHRTAQGAGGTALPLPCPYCFAVVETVELTLEPHR